MVAIIAVAIFVIVYITVYLFLGKISGFIFKKKLYRKVQERIKRSIKPLFKEVGDERKYLASEYEECVRMTKDKDVKAWGNWLLAQFYHRNPHRGKGFLDKAIEFYMEVVKKFSGYPFHEESLFQLGNLLFFEKFDHEKLCNVYQKLLDEYPQSKWVTIARERIALVRSNIMYPKALNDYILAEKYFEEGKYENSIKSLVNIIEEHPQSGLVGEALYFLGDIYHFKIKDYSQAIDEYQSLIQKFPQNRFVANSQFKTGECYRKLQMWPEAIEAYKKFIKHYGNYGYSDYAQFYIGQCYEEMKEWQEAKNAYSSISINYPESIWVDVARNRVKYLDKRYLGG